MKKEDGTAEKDEDTQKDTQGVWNRFVSKMFTAVEKLYAERWMRESFGLFFLVSALMGFNFRRTQLK